MESRKQKAANHKDKAEIWKVESRQYQIGNWESRKLKFASDFPISIFCFGFAIFPWFD
jgi:hypothetical protein